MAARQTARKATKQAARKTATKTAKKAAAGSESAKTFTEDERAAMRERAQELKAAKQAAKGDGSEESVVLEKIASMPEPDRSMAKRLHAIIKASAPALASRTWYGMPAYAKDGNVIVFFQGAAKFKSRYSTLGFSDKAALDDGKMWPASFALTELTPDVEARISALVKRAVG